MRGSQSSVKAYGAISPCVTNDFDQIGRILISDPNGKISLSARSISELGSGGGGDAPVYEPNRCLLTDQYGGANVSNMSSIEKICLTGVDSNTKTNERNYSSIY